MTNSYLRRLFTLYPVAHEEDITREIMIYIDEIMGPKPDVSAYEESDAPNMIVTETDAYFANYFSQHGKLALYEEQEGRMSR